jgi:3-hydroxyacyl-CoA dehydrogenase
MIVATRMAQLPKDLHLTARQKLQLREAFLDTAHKESHIIHTVPGFFRQRVLIAPIARALIQTEKKILTPAQFKLVESKRGRPTGF